MRWRKENDLLVCVSRCAFRVSVYVRVCLYARREIAGGDDDTRVVHDDDEEERMSTEPVAPEEVQAVLSALRLFLVAARI